MKRAILLVDDEKTILDSLKQQLKHQFGGQFAYETAENVSEAWEVIDELVESGVDILVVVSDWLMPGVRGDDFLVELRGRHPQIRRVMLTGQADAAALERVRSEAAVVEIIHKPWQPHQLYAIVEATVV